MTFTVNTTVSANNLFVNVCYSIAREVHSLQMVVMFVYFIVYNVSIALTEMCVCWFTEQHGFRGNTTICVQ